MILPVGSKENQKFEQLVQQIAPQSKLLRVWPLTGGISAEMTAFEMAYPEGQTQKMIVRRPNEGVLKRNPQAAANEFRLLQILQSAGLAVQTPYHLNDSGRIFSTPYLVIEYIEGKPEFAPANLADCVLQLATHLAAIHQVDCSALDLSFLPQHTQGCPETVGNPSTYLDQSLDEGHIRETLTSIGPLPSRNVAVLLHGDFWPGNVLWQAGRLVAVIDWEDAKSGDPLIDFANSRLELGWIFGVEAMHAFTDHYQSLMDLDYTHLPYWDLCAALRLIRLADSNLAGLVAFFAPFGRTDITEQTIRENYGYFIGQAFERLAIQ